MLVFWGLSHSQHTVVKLNGKETWTKKNQVFLWIFASQLKSVCANIWKFLWLSPKAQKYQLIMMIRYVFISSL